MSSKKKTGRLQLSRRDLLKFATSGLLAGITRPIMFGNSSAYAAGSALEGKRVLPAYYSRTDNTRTMEGYIREMAGGDIVRIETVDPYPSEYKPTTVQAKRELESGYKPLLKTNVEGMEARRGLVGLPCW